MSLHCCPRAALYIVPPFPFCLLPCCPRLQQLLHGAPAQAGAAPEHTSVLSGSAHRLHAAVGLPPCRAPPRLASLHAYTRSSPLHFIA